MWKWKQIATQISQIPFYLLQPLLHITICSKKNAIYISGERANNQSGMLQVSMLAVYVITDGYQLIPVALSLSLNQHVTLSILIISSIYPLAVSDRTKVTQRGHKKIQQSKMVNLFGYRLQKSITISYRNIYVQLQWLK